MATARVRPAVVETRPQEGENVPSEDGTFVFRLSTGGELVVGRPRGVLKLKVREVLTADQLKDPEIKQIATAFLAIRTIDGNVAPINTQAKFEALLARFANDEELESFMDRYQRLVSPELVHLLEKARAEALDKGIAPGDIADYVAKEVFAYQVRQQQKVRD